MIIRFLASGFGSGYLPFMPGTWGSVVGVLIVWTLFYLNIGLSLWELVLGTFLIGWICSHILVKQAPEDTDPSYIVIDEMAGIFLTFAVIQWYNISLSPFILALGFILFRVFDILKPFPIDWVDHKLGQSINAAGLGIMVDDLIAAIPAAIIVIFAKGLRFL